MPMFFYISGMSSTFFNSEKHGYLVFVKEKFNRLIKPLIMAILTLLVPRLYFSQTYESWTRVDDKIENNFLVYYIKVLPYLPQKLSWLWFLVVLFIVMLMNYPLMAWSQRRKKKEPLNL
jgi:fucose 4-O-acetylase-like acetyltransferase